ncbi:MAG: SDR family NAD(P)-dependent oxidoreductase [Parasporobacterium sp.]|nr:SDR family NAD(P)-dependent oxidoreductase [Parasporobacterium sp.]
MRDVCVITGGGNGIGLATAKYMPKEKILVICGRTESKLKAAAEELTALGHEVHYIVCDVSSRKDVHELCLFARSFGRIRNVIHAAGMSPSMGDPEKLVRVNAIGTKNINMEFYKYMEEGSVIVDVASNAAYQVPGFLIRKNIYSLAEKDEDAFVRKMTAEAKLPRGSYRQSGLAYALSKNFAVWYARKCAHEYGEKGIRVCSVSPGLVDTDMGRLEEKEAGKMLGKTAEKRMGTASELGFCIASAADERNGYLTGADILADGGCISA